ncbi:MAG: bifunctional folylpolyglutamate synthase/dihydrofolate synthase [Saprospiraceae bacterium]|jgi:dihydrofolate synthase/folylpolyglutamate synthase|nr:bifunctional folylpolyglutamate synthase/dihydrofolate synthase [Saprospiraceae bacterium]
MTYQECLDYMFAHLPMYHRVGQVAYKKDLGNIKALCERLGNPQDQLRCIHVAGTNGKGTVSHLLAFALQQQGFKTGLYTSPHYQDFRERIKVDGHYIEKSFVRKFIADHQKAIEEIQPSFFEITVAMAFAYFVWRKTDYAIIEVGLGGRLDSTNIITPLLSVITNISLDHTDMLGNTLEAIAVEKAGIIKRGIEVLIGERQEETTAVFERIAKEKEAPLVYSDQVLSVVPKSDEKLRIDWKNGKSLELQTQLTAPYQLKNIATAFAAMTLLTQKINLDFEKVRSQMDQFEQKVRYMGRWQVISRNPLVVADSAHNEGGLKYVFEKINSLPHQRLHIVTGMVNDKKTELVLHLYPKTAIYYFAKARIPRGKPAEMLRDEAAKEGLMGKAYTSTKKALAAALKKANREDIILITGSIFTVAEVLPATQA